MSPLISLLFVVLAAQDGASASPFKQTSTLKFNSPKQLQKEYPDGVDNSQAKFGSPMYGHAAAITGIMVYAASGDHDACEPFSRDNITNWPEGSSLPVIVLVDRGTCTFVTKVRHAQAVGASAAIIIDNVEEYILPIMNTDGTGSDISIPSVLIRKSAGAKIREFMKFKVTATMEWNLPHPDGRVEWDLWTSSDDNGSEQFKRQFQRVTESLGSHAKMTPHYFFIEMGCIGDQSLECTESCTHGGRYCAVDPEQDLSTGLTGAMVVEENLRQMCLWRTQVENRTDDPKVWFDYVVKYLDDCHTPKTWGEACSHGILTQLGVDVADITKCIDDSNVGENNTLIANDIKLQYDSGIFFTPTVTINNMPYLGALSCSSPIDKSTCGVLSAICSGYADGSSPQTCRSTDCELGGKRDCNGMCNGNGIVDQCQICFASNASSAFNQACAGCDGVPNSGVALDDCEQCGGPGKDKCGKCLPLGDKRRIEKDSKEECPAASAGGFPVWGIVVIVVGVVLVVGVGVFCVMRKREESMRADIDDLLKQYLPMDGATPGPAASHSVAVN